MKKLISLFLVIFIIATLFCMPVGATAISRQVTQIEYLSNGDYVETIIEDNGIQPLATNTITKTKTRYYKNSAGTVLWSVSVTGTFTYNGTTSTCTSCSKKTSCPATSWSIISSSVSKNGNSATAKATARQTLNGITHDYSTSVKITCSGNGTIS